MSIFTSLIKKETLHLLRDWRTLTVVLIMPVVLLLLFGFAISTEVNDIRVVAVADRHTDASRLIMERLRVNSYFTFKGEVPFNEVEVMLRRGETDAAVVLRTDGGNIRSQIITDASNTNMAQTSVAYIESVIGGGGSAPVITSTLYNPQLEKRI